MPRVIALSFPIGVALEDRTAWLWAGLGAERLLGQGASVLWNHCGIWHGTRQVLSSCDTEANGKRVAVPQSSLMVEFPRAAYEWEAANAFTHRIAPIR